MYYVAYCLLTVAGYGAGLYSIALLLFATLAIITSNGVAAIAAMIGCAAFHQFALFVLSKRDDLELTR